MEIGIVGLGRMGGNMARRMLRGNHRVVAYNRASQAVKDIEKEGAVGAYSLNELSSSMTKPRAIWLMIPAGEPVDHMIGTLLPLLHSGDIIIDGGNSYYKDTMRRFQMLKEKKISYVDCGTSGGIWGLTEGYSLMIGGEKDSVDHLRPIWETLAPAPDRGWGHVGPSGAGHFTKMVHNGIEYGMMQAFAEGFSILEKKSEFALDLHQVAEIWRFGSVVRSWLLDLTSNVFAQEESLKNVAPYVADSGEGRWTVAEAIDLDIPAPVITHSLIQRLRSRDLESFSDRILAAMRNQFGGHAVKAEEGGR